MGMKPIKVSQLNAYINRILKTDPILSSVLVKGEISNLKFHGSGHVYFTLKDEESKLNCFLSGSNLQHIEFQIEEGLEVTAEGGISVFEKGGTYSLNVRDLQIEGQGNLSIAFEKLKDKLYKEGLFDEKHKRPLPKFPSRVAIVTSETGAAVRDILKIIKGKNQIVDILIFPVLVQGTGAAKDIAGAIDIANEAFDDIDVMIVGRGGGSTEELWAFNEEVVARSIFNSKIPIISAVGHEIDFTISDFVADRRAETPTAAAHMAVPDVAELLQYVGDLKLTLNALINRKLQHCRLKLETYNPDSLIRAHKHKLELYEAKIRHLRNMLLENMQNKIAVRERDSQSMMKELEALSPKNVMDRGYGAVLNKSGKLISSVKGLPADTEFKLVMSDGSVDARVI